MISAVIQDNEERVGPLADGEVARLLSALQNAEFTRSDKHDLAKSSSFRQRSLIEIAAEAQKPKDANEIEQQSLLPDDESDTAGVENLSNVDSDSFNQENLAVARESKETREQTIRDISSKQTVAEETEELGAGVRGLTTNSNVGAETDEHEQGIRGLTSVPHDEVEVSETTSALRELTSSSSGLDDQANTNSFETANAAFERGKAEGISEGRRAAIAETKEEAIADAKAELGNIVDTFHNTLNSLARPKAMQLGAISSSIHKTILKLASERAGMQIDEMPEPFADRINALVTSIGQELADGKVQLNEDDYAIMKPYLANLDFEIVVSPNLMRGDVTLQFDGVELHDIAANRMASYPAEKPADFVAAAAENANAPDSAAADDKVSATDNATATDSTAAADSTAADDNAAAADTAAATDSTAAADNAAAIDTKEAPEQIIRDIASKHIVEEDVEGLGTGVRGLTTTSNVGTETDEQGQGIRGLTSVPHEEAAADDNAELASTLTDDELPPTSEEPGS